MFLRVLSKGNDISRLWFHTQTTVTCMLAFSPVNRKWLNRKTNHLNELHELQRAKQSVFFYCHTANGKDELLVQNNFQRKSLLNHFLGISFHFCECGACYLFGSFIALEQYTAFSQNAPHLEAVVYLLSGNHLLFSAEQQNIWDLERLGCLV